MWRTIFIVLSLTIISLPGFAQEGDAAATDSGTAAVEELPIRSAPETVDEITVTGTQSGVTDVQSEAAAVSAFSMDELDRANVTNVDQLAFNVPALHVGQQGANSIVTLRGVSTENASATGEAGVQFHVDGVNYGRPAAGRVAFFDLEGLQVARGPQGVKGGKNSTAGWISVVTRKPTADFTTDLDLQWGAYNERRLRGAVNIPINEYIQTRFATYVLDHDGYQDNLFFDDEDLDGFDADDFGYRAHLRVLPTDSLEMLFSYNYYEAKGVGPVEEVVGLPTARRCNPLPPPVGTGYNPLTNFPSFAGCGANPNRVTANGFLSPIYAATGFDIERNPRFRNFENPNTRGESRALAARASTEPHMLYTEQPASQDNRFWGLTATTDWDLPELPLFGATRLKNLTSYQVTDPSSVRDADGTDVRLFFGSTGTRSDQWSSELQWFGSAFEGLMDWQASAFWQLEQSALETAFIVQLGSTTLVDIDQRTKNISNGLALFTEWHLTDRLTIELGGRYIQDKKQNRLLRTNPIGSQTSFGAKLGVCDGPATDLVGRPFPLPNDPDREIADGKPDDPVPWCRLTFRQTVGDLRLNYQLFDTNLLYFSIGNGFKAGGFALGAARSNPDKVVVGDFNPDEGLYRPEQLWAFTTGSKNTFFDDRVTLNLEYFFYNYRDQQQVLVDGLSIRTDNADSEMMGVDLEYNLELLPGLRIDGFLSWLDTEFTDYLGVDPVDVIVAANCRQEAQNLDPNAQSAPPGCTPTDYSGNELTRSPEWTFSIGGEYDIYLGRFGTLTPRVQYYWQDDTWYRPFNRTLDNSGSNAPCPVPGLNGGSCRRDASGNSTLLNASTAQDLQEAYHYTDVRLTWRSPSENWTAEAFVQNLEDEVVYQNVLVGTPLLQSPQMAWYGHPRLYGFRIGFRY